MIKYGFGPKLTKSAFKHEKPLLVNTSSYIICRDILLAINEKINIIYANSQHISVTNTFFLSDDHQ